MKHIKLFEQHSNDIDDKISQLKELKVKDYKTTFSRGTWQSMPSKKVIVPGIGIFKIVLDDGLGFNKKPMRNTYGKCSIFFKGDGEKKYHGSGVNFDKIDNIEGYIIAIIRNVKEYKQQS